MESLGRPDPHARRDAHQQRHENPQHLGAHVRVLGVGAELAPVGELVEVAADDGGRWHSVEHREDADFHHQPLQLVCLGAVLLQVGADLEERHQAGADEQRA